MNIRPKSTDILKAQFAEYGQNTGSDKVFDHLASNALHETIMAHSDYVSHLRARTPEDRERVGASAALLARYEEFAEPIEALLTSEDKKLLGAGNHARVYLLTAKDGKYAVRVSQRANNKLVQRHLAASVRVQDLSGFERVVAASYEERVVVSEFVEGKHGTDITPEEAAGIPDAHIAAFVAARVAASERGIGFDPHAGNVLYSSENGFADIDYGIQGTQLDMVTAMHSVIDSFYSGSIDGLQEAEKKNLSAMRSRMTRYAMDHFTAEERTRLIEVMKKQSATNVMFGAMKHPGRFI